jgi:hypothetical protein
MSTRSTVNVCSMLPLFVILMMALLLLLLPSPLQRSIGRLVSVSIYHRQVVST